MFCVIRAEWTVSLSLLLLHDMMEKRNICGRTCVLSIQKVQWCAIYKIDILKKLSMNTNLVSTRVGKKNTVNSLPPTVENGEQ